MFKLIIILFYLCLTYVRPIFAQSKILINEFLIDPQPQSIEIFNAGTESADISDWIVDDSGGTTFYTIPKNNIIFPNHCLIFSEDFNLNKTSADTVRLINNFQLLTDSFSYKSSSGSGISHFRFPDGSNNWTTGSANLGFYNQTNVSCLISPSPTPTLTPTPTLSPTLTITPTDSPTPYELQPTPFSYDNIYLSEVMVNPDTGEKEWVEIYNDNNFSVSLNNWYVDDLENAGSSPKIFSLEINAKSYAVYDLTSSMFNNDGDTVRLLDFNKNLKDDFEYPKSETGKTLGRTSIDSDDFCIQKPSKNSANNLCISPTSTIVPTLSVIAGRTYPSSTKKVVQTKTSIIKANNFDVSIHRSINYPTGISVNNFDSGQILGMTDELMIDSSNHKSLINLLTILSTSYSLLTIVSILFKMKLSYGKSKKFYSPSLHSS